MVWRSSLPPVGGRWSSGVGGVERQGDQALEAARFILLRS